MTTLLTLKSVRVCKKKKKFKYSLKAPLSLTLVCAYMYYTRAECVFYAALSLSLSRQSNLWHRIVVVFLLPFSFFIFGPRRVADLNTIYACLFFLFSRERAITFFFLFHSLLCVGASVPNKIVVDSWNVPHNDRLRFTLVKSRR